MRSTSPVVMAQPQGQMAQPTAFTEVHVTGQSLTSRSCLSGAIQAISGDRARTAFMFTIRWLPTARKSQLASAPQGCARGESPPGSWKSVEPGPN